MIPSESDYFSAEQNKIKKLMNSIPTYQQATVESVDNNRVTLRFLGSAISAGGRYQYINSYSPKVNDKVILINGIIMGAVVI
jgi:hypothetical protein